jgi:Flp pilus assembly protein TadG
MIIMPFSCWSQAFASFAHDRRGVSAVEFAMLLPLLITLYLGSVEISQGVAIDRKVTLVSRTVGDLVSQASTIANTDMPNILDASSSVMAPYNAAPYSPSLLKVTVSQVKIDANSVAKIDWSCTRNGTARSVGSTVTVPTALNVPSTSLIWSEVSFAYTPTIGYVITGTLNLTDQIYMRPRLSDSVNAAC